MEKQGVVLMLSGTEYAAFQCPDGVEVKQVWEQNGWVLVKLIGDGLPGPAVEIWTAYRAGTLAPDGTILLEE